MLKPIGSIDDLRLLDGQPEDRTLELKREPIQTDALVRIIQAGANGVAPALRIIIGADEEDGRFRIARLRPLNYPLTVPKQPDPFKSFDAYKRHIGQVACEHTDGYFEGFFDAYEILVVGGSVVIIDVPQSKNRPHRHKGGKYHIRADGHVRGMKQQEVDAAVRLRRDLKPGAIVSIKDAETAAEHNSLLAGSAFLRVKILPETFSPRLDSTALLGLMEANPYAVTPIFTFPPRQHSMGCRRGVNKYGACIWLFDHRNAAITSSVVQVYEDGELQAVDSSLLSITLKGPLYNRDIRLHDSDDIVAAAANVNLLFVADIEEHIAKALPGYMRFVTEVLKFTLPLKVLVELSDVKDYRLYARPFLDPRDLSGRILQDDVFDSFVVASTPVLKHVLQSPTHHLLPFYRKIWQAAGKTRPEGKDGQLVNEDAVRLKALEEQRMQTLYSVHAGRLAEEQANSLLEKLSDEISEIERRLWDR